MRGDDAQLQPGMFSYIALEDRIPTSHPLRAVRQLVDVVLAEMSPEFDGLYAEGGRRSIPPERLLRALLLQVFYSIRSERVLIEQLDYNLLFRWFVGLAMDDPVWNHAVFSKNRDRLLNQEMARSFFDRIKQQAVTLMSDDHFTVDGTLIEAWASHKSFRRKDGGGDSGDSGAGGDFHGEKRTNQTHASSTDPDARLYRKSKGKEARLSYLGHIVTENRHGLIAEAMTTHADGTAEADAALLMLKDLAKRSSRITVGADKAYDVAGLVSVLRELNVTPHVIQNNKNRRSAIDGRTTRQVGYGISLGKRWLVEKAFGWLKQTGPLRKVKLRGLPKVDWLFLFSCAAFNLLRIPKLRAQCA
jgi:transposase